MKNENDTGFISEQNLEDLVKNEEVDAEEEIVEYTEIEAIKSSGEDNETGNIADDE